MKEGDLCLFYHSGKRKEIVGVVKVIKSFEPDPTDVSNRFGMVTVMAMIMVTVMVMIMVINTKQQGVTMTTVMGEDTQAR